jgi:hypothetical protein
MIDLKTVVSKTKLEPNEVIKRTHAIYEELLRKSRHVRFGNFQTIHPRDLNILFAAYDSIFFEGNISRHLGSTPLHFRLSRRLTSAAGKTTRRRFRASHQAQRKDEYEISISSTLLFQTFRDVNRTVTTSGIECRDRVEALQRVFEHELIHLVEMLVWEDSNCAAIRFQTIAGRFFSHREHTHQLITQRERARTKFGLQLGDPVTFQIDGQRRTGVINRITRRATVLVEDPNGVRYTNGKHYLKFYIPLDMLEKA